MHFRSWKLRWQQVMDSNRLSAINFNPVFRPRRQDWNGELIESGMFYFARRRLIVEDGVLQNDRLIHFSLLNWHMTQHSAAIQHWWFGVSVECCVGKAYPNCHWFWLERIFRCKFIEIDARHTLEIDDNFHLKLANILITIPDWWVENHRMH